MSLKFIANLDREVSKKDKNTFFSPFSIQVAMGMTVFGAKGETKQQLLNCLDCPDDKKYFADLISICNENKKDSPELNCANALWANLNFKFEKDYIEIINSDFKSQVNYVDYVNEAKKAVLTINNWCNENTKTKIPEIISEAAVNKDTRLVITNAIYFKGKWKIQYNKDHTTKRDFYLTKKDTKQVEMMTIKDNFNYFENDKFQAIEMNYTGDELSMVVVLPKDNNEITKDNYKTACDNFQQEEVIVYLPKFKVETEYKLKDALVKMGAASAFNNAADFSGMSTQDRLCISDVIHKAFVQCDEEGTEAAAATAVVMMRMTSFMPAKPPITFNANKPFDFYIRSKKTNAVLFFGTLNNP